MGRSLMATGERRQTRVPKSLPGRLGRVREIEIPLAANADCRGVEQAIERAVRGCGLRVSMRGSLAKFPGCIHWHLKNGA